MTPIVTDPRRQSARSAALTLGRTPLAWAAPVAIGTSWLLALAAQLSGRATAFHHHTLIEGGPPLWLALPLFLLTWQVMVAAMMLPASLPAVGALERSAVAVARPGVALIAFLAVYALVWSGYGAAAFIYDVGLHRFVDSVPWLGARPWLIESTAVIAAGLYQFLPLKRRGLAACRHPIAASLGRPGSGREVALAAGRFGLRHALDCLASSWVLMLLMFAAGFANLAWMAVLALAMVAETVSPRGSRLASLLGFALLGLGVLILATGWIPAFVAD